jgi:peroxiredoxin Q/BCP
VLKVVSSELRASAHADHTLRFLQNQQAARSSPPVREEHTDAHQESQGQGGPIGERFTEPESPDEPSYVRPYTLTGGRTDSDVELPLEAPVEALTTTTKSPSWPKNDVRGQILTYCVHSPSVAEIAAQVSLPLGATRFLVGDLMRQGYVRVHAAPVDSMTIDERRELIRRTLRGLRAL